VHEPKEAEIEAMLARRPPHEPRDFEVWRRGGRFGVARALVGALERALEACVPKSRHLREKDLKETLPWDVVDAFIRKPFLVVEWKKALKEMDTDDCKWGHCYACGVPGDGEDTVLRITAEEFNLFRRERRAGPAGDSVFFSLPSSFSLRLCRRPRGRVPMKATPDLCALRERRAVERRRRLSCPAQYRSRSEAGDAVPLALQHDGCLNAVRAWRARALHRLQPTPQMSMAPRCRSATNRSTGRPRRPDGRPRRRGERAPPDLTVSCAELLKGISRSGARRWRFTRSLAERRNARGAPSLVGQAATTPKFRKGYGVPPEGQSSSRARLETVLSV
jgi:hypothetical protein